MPLPYLLSLVRKEILLPTYFIMSVEEQGAGKDYVTQIPKSNRKK